MRNCIGGHVNVVRLKKTGPSKILKMGSHLVSDFYTMLQYSFTHVTIVSDGNVNFPE